jgi:hypothetical protein
MEPPVSLDGEDIRDEKVMDKALQFYTRENHALIILEVRKCEYFYMIMNTKYYAGEGAQINSKSGL